MHYGKMPYFCVPSILSNVLSVTLWPNMWSIFITLPHILVKNAYSAVWEKQCCRYVYRSRWLIVFKSSQSSHCALAHDTPESLHHPVRVDSCVPIQERMVEGANISSRFTAQSPCSPHLDPIILHCLISTLIPSRRFFECSDA